MDAKSGADMLDELMARDVTERAVTLAAPMVGTIMQKMESPQFAGLVLGIALKVAATPRGWDFSGPTTDDMNAFVQGVSAALANPRIMVVEASSEDDAKRQAAELFEKAKHGTH